jgi:hypothetical protein
MNVTSDVSLDLLGYEPPSGPAFQVIGNAWP